MPLPPLDWLQSLNALHEEGSLLAASKKRGLSQPALSWQMKGLQKFFDRPLFEKRGRRILLNDFARKLVQAARPPLEQMSRQIDTLAREAASPEKIHLRIGARLEILRRLFSNLNFVGSLEFIEMGSIEATRALRRGSVDLAVSRERPSVDDFLSKKLFHARTALIVPKSHFKKTASVAEMRPQLTRIPAAAYSHEEPYLSDFLKLHGLRHAPVNFFVSNWDLIEERVHEGKAWSIVPLNHCSSTRNYWMRETAVSAPKQDFFLFYRKEFRGKTWMNDLIAQVHKNLTVNFQ